MGKAGRTGNFPKSGRLDRPVSLLSPTAKSGHQDSIHRFRIPYYPRLKPGQYENVWEGELHSRGAPNLPFYNDQTRTAFPFVSAFFFSVQDTPLQARRKAGKED